MYTTIKTFSLLAIAGTAIAAPQGWDNWAGHGYYNGGDNQPAATATDVAVVTAYTTVFANGAKPTASAEPAQFYTKPETSAAAVATTWQTWAPSSTAAAEPVETSAPSTGEQTGYMGVVATWRSKMGLSALSEDSTLQGNALKTAQDGNGQMVHELNSGSMAQVLAPGSDDEFEKVFVGGWLCEVPSAAGLDGICSSMSAGWDYAGQTGHADILSSKSYSKIGCACAGGIWACDLA